MPDIVITPNRGSSTNNPKIDFTGITAGTIKLEVLSDGTITWNGASGSLFSIADSLTGSLMSVNDISGLPLLEVFSDNRVIVGQFGARLGIGTVNPSSSAKLHIAGLNTAPPNVFLQTTNSAANGGIFWRNNTNTTTSAIASNYNISDSSGNIEFLTGGTTTRMSITSGGLVKMTDTTDVTGADTGALQVKGGIYVEKGGRFNNISLTTALSVTSGGTGLNSAAIGDIFYGSAANTLSALAGNTTATKRFLTQTGTGSASAAPAWGSIVDGDIPAALTGKTYNALTLTALATGFSIAGGTASKTLTVSNTLTLSGTDSSTLNIGSGGTLGTAAFTASTTYTSSGIVPNTTPSAGQILVGNASGTAYAPVSVSGDITITSAGVTAIGASKVTNAMLVNSSITFGSTAQALGSTISAINGVSIGASTASTGNFTTVTAAAYDLSGTTSSSQGSGAAIQRVFSKSVSAGQLYKLCEYLDTEGDVAFEVQVSSETSGHSGTSTYRFQGAYQQLTGSYYRLYPFDDGLGHGDGPDTGLNANAWKLYIYGTTVSGSDYRYGIAIHVPSDRTGKTLVVTVTELKRGMTYTDQSTSSPITTFTETGNIYSHNNLLVSGNIIAGRYRGINSLVLNNFATVNPASNVFIYSQPNDRDSWIYLDSADTTSNWGIYHRQIDSAVGGLPANSIGFVGGGSNALQAYISLANGNAYFAGTVTATAFSGTASSVSQSATFNSSGSGDASPTTYNGSAARTISYNTLGAAPTASPTFTGRVTMPAASSTAGLKISNGFITSPTSGDSGVIEYDEAGGVMNFINSSGLRRRLFSQGSPIDGSNIGDTTPASGTFNAFAVMASYNATFNGNIIAKNSINLNGAATAVLTLPGGSTTKVPIFLTSGTLATTAVAHGVEWDGTNLFITNSSAARKTVAYTDSNITGTASNITGTYGGTLTSSQITTALSYTPAPVYRGTASISNAGYTCAFTVTGSDLASAIRFTVQGTANNVVVNSIIDLTVNHSQDIIIKSISGIYTLLTVRVISNNDDAFAVLLTTNSPNAAVLRIEVFPLNSESITFTSTNPYTGSTLTHDCNPGIAVSATGGNNGDIRASGSFISTVATGTAPLTVSSTTQVANLNSQYLNGYSSDTANTANAIVRRDGSGNFTAGTITATTFSGTFSGSADQAFTNQHNGNASQWYGRILSKNSTSDKASFLGTYGTIAGVFAHNNALSAWTDLYINTVDGSTGGTVRMPSSVLINGNQALHAGNYTSYSPSLSGTGATGTWSIGISGASDRTLQLISQDVRTISPASHTAGRGQFGFTSWTNNNNAPYADYFHLRSYTDSSGGNDNLVMFRKDAIGMRIWQQTFGSSTAYASYKDVAFTDSNITGSAGSVSQSITFNNGGSGDASSTSYNGSVAKTISYNTIGAAPTASPTFTGRVTIPAASSTAGLKITSGFITSPTSSDSGVVEYDGSVMNFINSAGQRRRLFSEGSPIDGSNIGDTTPASGTFNAFATMASYNAVFNGNIIAKANINLNGAAAAVVTMPGGSASKVPIFLTSGTLATTAVAHGVEWDGTSLYITNSSAARKTVAYTDSNISGTASNVTGIVASANGGTGINNGGRTLTISTNSGTISFTNTSTTLTVANNASVSGTNTGDQTTVSGNAGTATTWQTARTLTIGATGKSVDGSANVSWSASEIGTSGNTASTVVARDTSGNFSANTVTAALSGNASTATTLQTARNIAGVSFNGSADISITGQNITTSSGNASNDIEVAKYMRWKNYGNNHILIDASQGTNPGGTAIDRYTPANTINSTGAGGNTWGEAISLMGWNGSATYGVRVDRARSIDNQANSATITAATANTASTIVLRDGSGNFSAGTVTVSTLSATDIPNVRRVRNGVYNNLGNPTVEEQAIIHGEFNNKFRFWSPTSQEQSTNGTTWTASTRASAQQLADIMIGEGQSGYIDAIPAPGTGNAGYYRLTWDSTASGSPAYCFLDAFYCYNSTNGNNVTFTVEAQDSGTSNWVSIATGTISNWPGHTYIPHSSLPYVDNATAGYYKKVRITFAITSAAAYGTGFSLYGIEWWGGYPAGRRNVEYFDSGKNVYWPAAVNGTRFVSTVATGTAPFTVSSTTQVTNLNSQYLNGYSSDTANTANAIVRRDGTGNFSAGLISSTGLNSSGAVGIGTTTPQSRLDVFSGLSDIMAASIGYNCGTNTFAGFSFGYQESGNGNYRKSALVFQRTDGHGQGANASGKIHLLLRNDGANSATSLTDSVVTIDSDASGTRSSVRFGIGTTTPSKRLEVVGGDALINVITVGRGSGNKTTNTAVGASALFINNSSALNGNYNSAFGYQALRYNTSGSYNTAIGWNALLANEDSGSNTAIGANALANITFGNLGGNIGIGTDSGSTIDAGSNNIVIGNSTTGITSGNNNVIIGHNISSLTGSLSNNIIIADGSGNRRINVDSSGNVSINANTATAGVKLDVTGNIGIQSENSLRLYSSTNYSRIYASSTLGLVINGRFNGSFYNMAITAGSSSTAVLYALTDGRVNIDPDGYGTVCSGTISDAYGNLRVLPENAKTAAYTLATTDTGRLITITTGGITVPASGTAAITAGMVFTIVNKSGSDQTITQASGVTLRLSGTSTTGNRTLSTYGVATIVCIGTSDFVISGSGLF